MPKNINIVIRIEGIYLRSLWSCFDWVSFKHLTRNSPAVMFCRAPTAPSRVHVFVSQTCRMRLYKRTI